MGSYRVFYINLIHFIFPVCNDIHIVKTLNVYMHIYEQGQEEGGKGVNGSK